MRILALYTEDYPWDVRIEKILGGMANLGHEVVLVCRNTRRSAESESVRGIRCRRIPGGRVAESWAKVISIPAPFNPIWRSASWSICRDFDPDLIFVRDVPLGPLALDLGRRASRPVIVDMAENHPALWRNVGISDRYKIRSFIMKNPRVALAYERKIIGAADAILVVVEEMRDRLVELGADPSRVHVVTNTPELLKWQDPAPATTGEMGEEPGRLDLLFVGLISRTRGLETVLRAMLICNERGWRPRFHVVGSGAYLHRVMDAARSLGVDRDVLTYGWVDHAALPDIVARCNVGIIPHLVDAHTDTTVPNKLFDYMCWRLPVIVSDARPLARIVEECGCGLAFNGDDGSDLARCLDKLRDMNVRSHMGESGRRAIETRYHWKADFQVFVDVASKLVG